MDGFDNDPSQSFGEGAAQAPPNQAVAAQPSPNTTTPATTVSTGNRTARIMSYVFAAMALCAAGVTVYLFFTQRKTTTRDVTPELDLSPSQAISYSEPLDVSTYAVKAQTPLRPGDSGNGGDSSNVQNNDNGDDSKSNSSSSSSDSDKDTGLFSSTPISVPPDAFGFCAMTSDASQIIISSQHTDYLGLRNYWLSSSDSTYSNKDEPAMFVVAKCPTNKEPLPKDNNVPLRSLGSVGPQSMCMSYDGARLYVAYEYGFLGTYTPGADGQLVPFGQRSGGIGVFVRTPETTAASIRNNKVTGRGWAYACSLHISNPSGSFFEIFSTSLGPRMGTVIQSTFLRATNTRVVAVRINYTPAPHNRPAVLIYEEDKDAHVLMSIIHPPETGDIKDVEIVDDDFASSFDIADTTCIVRAATHDQKYVLLVYQRDDGGQWNLTGHISAPDEHELFGTSVILSENHADRMIVGSPGRTKSDGPGEGGSVYFYKLEKDENDNGDNGDSDTGTWTKSDAISNLDDSHTRAFGTWVRVNQFFRVATISANQDNRDHLGDSRTDWSGKSRGEILVVGLDEKEAKFVRDAGDKVPYHSITQQDKDDVATYDDPLFGAATHTAFFGGGENDDHMRVFAGEPVNQIGTPWYLDK